MNYKPIYIVFICLYISNLYSSERYICKQNNENTNNLIINFYVIKNKLIMSGASTNGDYKILKKNKNGLLATNSSFIGSDYGLETILIDFRKNIFIYKSLISGTKRKNIMEFKGTCN